ncbi:citrate synthase-like protein [Catenaria anguillulae PL171]|uniref:Citrate synthase n=1 Tax=Catenaria anguillulae PL171 TaxID=765915 RepID=A0A1Y2I229_9FUNG|nr:citrate synthase-like protein [Catenaria anguillulae PL171]
MTDAHSVTLTNAQTGQSVDIPIDANHPIIPAAHLKQLHVLPANPPPAGPTDTVPLCLYDPGFSNTVACRSRISHVSGKTGQLLYRGFEIEDLYEHSSFTEVAYLLIHGDLPTKPQFDHWQRQLLRHTYLHSELERQLATFRWDAHPMGMLIAALSSLSSFHPEANPALVGDALYTAGPREQYVPFYKLGSLHATEGPTATQVRDHVRNKQVYRILGKLPTIAANVFRHREGRPYNHPMPSPRSITENFLYMLDKLNEPDYVPDRVLVQLLDKAFILLAEHGSSCSTITMRHLVSSGVDPFTATSGACGALFGERKSSEVIRMLEHIGTPDGIANYLDMVKQKKSLPHLPRAPTSVPTAEAPKGIPIPSAPLKLQGWGHRIYKGPDPRVRLMRDLTLKCFQHVYRADPEAPSTHLVYLALQLEKAVLADEYFMARKIFPNIDFWTAILFHTMGFPRDMFAVLMTIPRSAGYLAHFIECVSAKEQIYRPRQVYLGETLRDYVPVGERGEATTPTGSAAAAADQSDAKSIAAKSTHALESVSVAVRGHKLARGECVD